MATNQVWKYPLALQVGDQPLELPEAAEVVHFNMQAGRPTLWALVNPDNRRLPRTFLVVGTGHPVPENTAYRGTCLDGAFVWHLFERRR